MLGDEKGDSESMAKLTVVDMDVVRSMDVCKME
jgi:hypothetical protein